MCACLATLTVLLAGCTGKGNDNRTILEQMLHETAKKKWVSVDRSKLPPDYTKILTDSHGYDSEGDKYIPILDSNPGNVYVIDATTDKEVYRGSIQESDSDGISVLDISDYHVPGTYYIMSEEVGYSESFEIKDDWIALEGGDTLLALTDILKEYSYTVGENKKMNEEEVREVGSAIVLVMSAVEDNPQRFEKEDGSNTVLPIVGDAVDLIIANVSDKGDFVSPELIAIYASTLSSYAKVLNEYDTVKAGEYLAIAQNAYYENKTAFEDNDSPESYMMFCQLFKSSGKPEYHEEIKKRIEGQRRNPGEDKYIYVFAGDMAYLSTKRLPDPDLCTAVMSTVSDDCAAYAKKAKDEMFDKKSGSGETLDSLMRLCFLNSVITNREYRRIIDSELHYLNGCNVSGTVIGNDSIMDLAKKMYILSMYK